MFCTSREPFHYSIKKNCRHCRHQKRNRANSTLFASREIFPLGRFLRHFLQPFFAGRSPSAACCVLEHGHPPLLLVLKETYLQFLVDLGLALWHEHLTAWVRCSCLVISSRSLPTHRSPAASVAGLFFPGRDAVPLPALKAPNSFFLLCVFSYFDGRHLAC